MRFFIKAYIEEDIEEPLVSIASDDTMESPLTKEMVFKIAHIIYPNAIRIKVTQFV